MPKIDYDRYTDEEMEVHTPRIVKIPNRKATREDDRNVGKQKNKNRSASFREVAIGGRY